MIGSIAAIAMLTPVLIVCGLLLLRMRNHFPGWIRLALAVAVAIAVGSVALRFHKDDTGAGAQAQQRSVIIPTTWHAVHDHFPVGSGGGSFPLIYPFYEKPEAATPEYINHAHCDYMEVALEYGLAGILLILAAVGIGLLRIVPTWRLDGLAGARAREPCSTRHPRRRQHRRLSVAHGGAVRTGGDGSGVPCRPAPPVVRRSR